MLDNADKLEEEQHNDRGKDQQILCCFCLKLDTVWSSKGMYSRHNGAYVVWNLFVNNPNVFITQLKIHSVTAEY